jgi:hypothetical protein
MLTQTTPAVSVVMPVRGVAPFIGAALDSIVRQSGVSFEIICIDDGAAPRTLGMMTEWAADNPMMRVIANNGNGISDALNLGISRARGRFVARMDADDIALPGRLSLQVAYLERHPEVVVLGTQALLIDKNRKVIRTLHVPVGSSRVHEALKISCALIHPTVMMNRNLILEVGGYRSGFDGAEDYELWLRLAGHAKLDNLSEPLLLYRRHEDQVTLRRQFHQARMAALALAAHRLRRSAGLDVLAPSSPSRNWRILFSSLGRAAFEDVRILTACSLADNGGTLRASGTRYLRLACQSAARRGSDKLHGRLALACVRHQVQLARSGRRRDATHAVFFDLLFWRQKLLMAYLAQISSLWRSKPQFWALLRRNVGFISERRKGE